MLIINTLRILTSDISNTIQIRSNYIYISRTFSQKLNSKVNHILKIKTTILNLHLHHFLLISSFDFFLSLLFSRFFSSFISFAHALKLFIKTLIYMLNCFNNLSLIKVFLKRLYRFFTSERLYNWSRLFYMLNEFIQNLNTFLMFLNKF